MKRYTPVAISIAIILASFLPAHATDLAGTWTKTTHPDPNNITLLYSEGQTLKAVGFEQVANRPAFWHGEGKIENGQVEITYHYSADGTPLGWEPDGIMQLTVSEDGRTLSGMATSRSGAWSEEIEYRRISVAMQP
jgi:hypothetical protein